MENTGINAQNDLQNTRIRLKQMEDAYMSERKARERAESRCNHLTNECAKLARRNADIEKERDELREIVRELADQEIHENDLDASYVRTSLIVKARRVLGGEE